MLIDYFRNKLDVIVKITMHGQTTGSETLKAVLPFLSEENVPAAAKPEGLALNR